MGEAPSSSRSEVNPPLPSFSVSWHLFSSSGGRSIHPLLCLLACLLHPFRRRRSTEIGKELVMLPGNAERRSLTFFSLSHFLLAWRGGGEAFGECKRDTSHCVRWRHSVCTRYLLKALLRVLVSNILQKMRHTLPLQISFTRNRLIFGHNL